MKTRKSQIQTINSQQTGGETNNQIWYRFALAWITTAGFFSACSGLMSTGSALITALIAGTAVLVLCALISGKTKNLRRFILGLCAASVVLVIVSFLNLIPEVIQIAVRGSELLNDRFHTEFQVTSTTVSTPLYACILWGVAAALFSLWMFSLSGKKSVIKFTVIQLVSLLISFLFQKNPSWVVFVLLIAGIIFNLLFYSNEFRKIGKKMLISFLMVALCAVLILVATGNYSGSAWVAEFRDAAAEWFDSLRYGSDTLPKGDFEKAYRLALEEEPALEVRIGTPDEMYLRGFIGCSYAGDRWEEFPMSEYQTGRYHGILEWMDDLGFKTAEQYANYNLLETETAPETDSISVKNSGAYRKYLYLPVSAWDVRQGRGKQKKDLQICALDFFGCTGYSFENIRNAEKGNEVSLLPWTSQKEKTDAQTRFLYIEMNYQTFVKEKYTFLDAEQKEEIQTLFFADGVPGKIGEKTDRIREVLESMLQNDPKTMTEYTGEEDFVSWSLSNAAGNDITYATLATLAFRAAGQPARYVEGYYLSAQAGKEAEEGIVKLTDQNAHAWVEVYIPAAGWLPVEVVPGMYAEDESKTEEEAPDYGEVENWDEGNDDSAGTDGGSFDDSTDLPGNQEAGGSILILCVIVLVLLLLALELQRSIRKQRRKKAGFDTRRYSDELFSLMRVAGVKGNYTRPFTLAALLEKSMPGTGDEIYQNVLKLLQKERFGQKELSEQEILELQEYLSAFKKQLKHTVKWYRRPILRYKYLL